MSAPTGLDRTKTNKLAQIIAYTASRYNLANGIQRTLALGIAAIMIQTREFQLSSADPDRDLLDWLSKPHSDANLVKACKEVLEQPAGFKPGLKPLSR